MVSVKPRKQIKEIYNAPQHLKRKWLSSHLEESLLLKYGKRAVSVAKGDTVRVMRGSFKGHEDKVVRAGVGKRIIEIEGITMTKADGNKIPKPIHPSNVEITKLNLTDKWRRKKLERGLSEETKKEIEKEAQQQIKEAEEEKKHEEELKALEEAEKEAEDIEEAEEIETTEKKEETPTEKPKPKVEEKKEEKKPEPKKEKTPTPKKPTEKKTATKKQPAKKTPTKTTKKKEENK
ncbi:MAG: 50S ribosomal protein L24 [Thermoplasmatales archaeon]|nr:50S ribosomal protein L24 [Thermoplasmatales archaeon]MCK4996108.1 50S ribosomal protein L24 [Thermoplasmatales archaeon]